MNIYYSPKVTLTIAAAHIMNQRWSAEDEAEITGNNETVEALWDAFDAIMKPLKKYYDNDYMKAYNAVFDYAYELGVQTLVS